jgi:hypothetical protein
MLVPPKKQTEPVLQKSERPIPTKMQTRSMTAEKRRVEEDAKDRRKEMAYWLGVKTTHSQVEALTTPAARAQQAYAQRNDKGIRKG